MLFRFRQQCLHQPPTPSLTLPPRGDRDGANLGEMGTVEMKRTAAYKERTVFQHHEIPNVLANLSQGSWQKCAVGGIVRDQSVYPLGIRQYGVTSAHELPRKLLQSSAWLRPWPGEPVPALCPPAHHGLPTPTPESGRYRNPGQTGGSRSATGRAEHPGVRTLFPGKLSRLCPPARAPAGKALPGGPGRWLPPRHS